MTKEPNPGGLPRGAGSMQMRRRCWWLIYSDANGRVVQENSHTDDPAKARRLLTAAALRVSRARVRELESIQRSLMPDEGAAKSQRQAGAARTNGRPRPHRAPVAKDARNRAKNSQGGGQ
jgi:hypothetical protein